MPLENLKTSQLAALPAVPDQELAGAERRTPGVLLLGASFHLVTKKHLFVNNIGQVPLRRLLFSFFSYISEDAFLSVRQVWSLWDKRREFYWVRFWLKTGPWF